MISRLKKSFDFLNGFINKGHSRSVKAKKNILGSLVIRGCSILISFLLFPLTLNYINPAGYGIWLTLTAIVGWFTFFDIGLAQGLRNKFAEAKAKGDDSSVQAYVSTTYAVLAIICLALWLIFIVVNQSLNWSDVLKLPSEMQHEISLLAIIVFTHFCLQFVLRIITTILIADQQPAKSSLIDLISQLLSMLIIIVLVKTTAGSLIKLGLAFCSAPILVLLLANIFLFKGKYKSYRPTFSKVNFSYAKGLFNLGLVFFIIQLAGVIQFETANIIIARNFLIEDVTSYNIVYKYFGMTNMVFVIFLTPFWSACTEAYHKKDFQWIRNGIRKYNLLNIVIVIVGAFMLLFSQQFYDIWLGKGKVNISFLLSLWGFIFFNISIFGGKYVSFLNGISALRIQLWACVLSPFIYVLVSLVLIKQFQMGVYALFVASVVANFNSYLLAPIQYYQVVIKGKKGIWVK